MHVVKESRIAAARDAIRGAALGPFVTWYAGAHGRAGLERALAGLTESERARFDPSAPGLGISGAAWYPAGIVHRMLDGLLDGMDAREREALAASGADHAITASLDGYLGLGARMLGSPQLCATLGPRLWHAFYRAGRVRIDPQGRRCHVMEVSDWPGHHGFLCAMNNASGRAIYRAMGCEAVTTQHAACIDRGDQACVYVIRW